MYIKKVCLIHLVLLLLSGYVLLFTSSLAHAQTDEISWEIDPGFDGSYRMGTWFPVTITISNPGPDVNGIISVRLSPGQTATYNQSIELPHNAEKRVVLPVFAEHDWSARPRAQVILRDGATILREETINLNALDVSVTTIGVVSDDSGALPELAQLRFIERDQEVTFPSTLVRLSPANMPERAELLQTFNVLFLHALDTSNWNDEQRAALRFWVLNGGHLVVGGDERTIGGLDALVPATVAMHGGSSTLRGLAEATDWRISNRDQTVSLLQLEAKPGTEVVAHGDAGQPLLVRQILGSGSINVAAFDLQALREVGDASAFWPRVLPILPQQSSLNWMQLREQGLWTLQQALNLPTRNFPSIWSLWGFLLLYIAAIGPLNYLLLRRLNRREWAYVTVPLLVLLFSGGAYAWGSFARGTTSLVNQLTIARALHDTDQGRAFSYVTLFSPTRSSYDLQFGADALVSDLQRPWERQERPLEVVDTDAGTEVPDLLVDVGAVRPLVVEHPIDVPQLEATLRTVNDEQHVTLRNWSNQPISDLVLARGDGMAQQAMTLGPGEERMITINNSLAILDALPSAGGDSIDRQIVLRQLGSAFLPAMAARPWDPMGPMDMPPPDVVVEPMQIPEQMPGFDPVSTAHHPDLAGTWYILGWQERAPVDVVLDGRAVNSTGEILYIWMVEEEQ
jgi:hypothetical protein